MDIKKSDQHHLGFGTWTSSSFWILVTMRSSIQGSAFWWVDHSQKIHDSAPVTTLFSKLGSVSSCSKMSRHICTCPYTHLHTCSFCPSFSNLCTIFAQIFRNDPPNPLTIHIQLICYHSNSKTAIAPYLFSHTLNIFFCSACGWPPTPWSSSTSSLPSLNLLCHSKRQVLDILEATLVLQLEFL